MDEKLVRILALNKPHLTASEEAQLSELSDGLARYDTLSWEGVMTWLDNNGAVPCECVRKGPIDWSSWRSVDSYFAVRDTRDYTIRRLRLFDLQRIIDPEMRIELEHLGHLDIVLVANLAVWVHIWGFSKYKDLRDRGLFNDLDTFLSLSSAISSYVKRGLVDSDETKQALSEINTLTGYLQGVMPGFDTRDELRKLAEGGALHGVWPDSWENEFKASASFVIDAERRDPIEFSSFEEYVKGAEWITSGASSIGKMEAEFDGAIFKFKSRKNMILDIMTPDELWKVVSEWDGVLRSKAFIKDELSKQRLAVASNIEAYLHESYIMKLYGGSYKYWKGITLAESDQDAYNREVASFLLMKDGCHALPFDFRRFDHQPTTDEIEWMVEAMVSRIVVPADALASWKNHVRKVIGSYRRSFISMQINGVTYQETVTGGLPSGVRFTSIFGNLWNAVVTDIVRRLATRILGYDPLKQLSIKGDDTAIVCSTAAECLLMRYCYQAVNAVGLNSKFGVSGGQFEFLRNEIGVNGVRGWSNRTIASVLQRKPWLAMPFSPISAISTTAGVINTLERRLCRKLPLLHQCSRTKWSRFYSQSTHWLDLPIRMGGLGVYPWRGWVPNGKLPKPSKPVVRVEKLVDTSTMIKWDSFSPDQMRAYHAVEVDAKVGAADIPGMSALANRKWAEEVRKRRVVWTRALDVIPVMSPARVAPLVIPMQRWPRARGTAQRSDSVTDLSLDLFLRQYNIAVKAGIVKRTVKEYLRVLFPKVFEDMVTFERRGWHRTDAITLASGSTPVEPMRCHPAVSAFVIEGVAQQGVRSWFGRSRIASRLYYATSIQTSYVEGRPSYAFFRW